MLNPFHRLYRVKLALLATVATFVGAALLFTAHWADGQAGWHWLRVLPVLDVGSALFTSGLIVIFFEYVGKEDEEQQTLAALRRVLKQAAPDIRDAVVDGFAFAPKALTAVASDDTLDRVIENSLAIRLGDQELAHDAYTNLREQVVRARERWYGVHVNVTLSPWEAGPPSGEGSMFVATVAWEFRVRPASKTMRFSCVSDLDEYRDLLQDPTSTEAWYFKPIGQRDASSPEVFELLQFTVNGKARPARRTTRRGSQTYAVSLGGDVGAEPRDVAIAYTYRALVQKNGHLLHVDPAQPVKGFTVRFNYSGCGIRYLNVLDYIAGAKQTHITQLPATDRTPSAEVSYEGWVFPNDGVVVVWVLNDEMESASFAVDRKR